MRLLLIVFSALVLHVHAQVPPPITNISPADGAVDQSITPTFTWSATPDPGFFELMKVEYTSDITWTTYDSTSATGSNSFGISGLEWGTTYYWRVRWVSPNYAAVTSPVTSFTTVTPPPPNLAVPSDNSTAQELAVNLIWNMVSGAAAYRVQVATDAGFTSLIVNNSSITTNNYNLSGLNYYTNYWWRVSTIDGNSLEGDPSAAFTFRTKMANPVLVSPLNGSVDNSINPVLTWNAVTGADDYHLQLASNAGFTSILLDSVTTDTSVLYYPGILANGTQYYWRVRAQKTSENSGYTSAAFTTVAEVIPYLNWPTAGTTVYTLTPTLGWYILAPTVVSYDVQISTSAAFPLNATIIYDAGDTAIYTVDSLLPSTTYYWRVRTKTSGGVIIKYSATENFVTYGSPTVPVPTYPTGGTTVWTYDPVLTWFLPLLSDLYTFEVRYKKQNDADWVDTVQTGAALQHQLSSLDAATIYQWQVRSHNSNVYSAWSATESFSTYSLFPPPPVYTLYPKDSVTVYTSAPTLYWYAAGAVNGITYQVQLSFDETFTDPGSIFDNIPAVYHTVGSLEADTVYYWRVRSYNGSSYSGWSGTAEFRTDVTPWSSVPVLTYPTGGASIYAPETSLNWYITGGIATITYHIQVALATDVLFSSPVFNQTGNKQHTAYISGLSAGTNYIWRVRSFDGTNYSDWASAESFSVTGTTGSLQPIPLYPINGEAVSDTSVQFVWYVNGLSAVPLSWEIEYNTTNSFTGTATISGITVPSVASVGLVYGATYYYRLRTYNGTAYSSWSGTQSFTTPAGPAPAIPIVGSPSANTVIASTAPVLSWFIPVVQQQLSYEVEYSLNANFSGAQVIIGVTGQQAPLSGLSAGSKYYWRVRAKNQNGTYSPYSGNGSFTVNGVTGVQESGVPIEFNLAQNYPNPFNPATRISFTLPQQSSVYLKIYNMLGQEVAALINGEVKSSGYHEVVFDASRLSSGVYLYKLSDGKQSMTRKLVLLK